MIFPMISSFSIKTSECDNALNYNPVLERISESNAVIALRVMRKKRINSLLFFLEGPAAIYKGTHTAALLICETNSNLTLGGNLSFTKYISFTNSKLLIQGISLLTFNI
ncbi:hypothetical protein EL17_23060 [Anditalea andensis]|uniref:Uncharacterized protein n=1 Tax=Anditalea andensis TaxID=1048983 RepID=A0A074LPN6_9BACT|nr:hypothetical protein EL17_23060 [Anditalea andensis]